MRTVKPKGKAIDINKYINTGYDKVVLVADNMEMLTKLTLILDDNGFKNVVAHLNDIVVVANSITNVVTVSGIADDVVVVANNVSDVVVVSHNIEDIKLVAEHIQAVQRVADSANNVDRLALSANALDIVATSVVSVDKVAASIDAVESVSSILSSVVRVSASADNVDIVANDIDGIKAVPTYMTEIRQAVTTTTTNAQTSTTNATSALASKNAASASEIAANASKVASKASQDAAKMSELAAYSSELSSLANAEASEASKTAAKAAETNAIANSTSSYNYSELARGYANAAEVSKGESIQAASDSSTSASASLSSANAAKVSEDAAKASQVASKTSETASKASENASKASELAAKTSETTAIAKATQTAADAVKTGNDVVQSAANASLAEAAKNESQAIAAALTGGIVDKGAWNASTGVFPAKPTRPLPEGGTALVSAFWKVTVAGTAGGISFLVGDDLRFSASTDSFYKVDNTDAVASVQGKTGAVTLSASEVGALATPTGTFAINKVIVAGSAAGTSQYSPYTIDKSVPSNAVFTDTVYTHPTTDGNLHVPATGTTNNGKALVAGATAGSAAWRALVTSDIGGLAAALDAKLDATANAVSATKLQNTVTINGMAFDGSANITINAASPFTLTRGTGLTGANYNGAAATTWAVAYGTAAGTACQGNDARLSDARTPLAHSHGVADVTGLQGLLDSKYSSGNTNIGTGAANYAAGNHLHTGVYAPAAHTHNYLPATGGALTGELTVPIINLNRSASPVTGYGYYSSAYNTWQTYMSDAGTANSGKDGNITAPSGEYVTTWAIRSVVENQAGYGWTWESMPNGGTSPLIMMELSSSSGNLKVGGTVTATAFVGNATTSTTLQTARTLTIGSTGKSFNGSANVSWSLAEIGAAATSHSHASITSNYTNWVGNTEAATVGSLAWRNYGNNHVIFDASSSLTPSGSACNNTNPQYNWSPSYPTLMGFNGEGTYGVRVDRARLAETLNGLDLHYGRNNEANKVVRTDANGYLDIGWLHTISGATSTGTLFACFNNTNDMYLRYMTAEQTRSAIGAQVAGSYAAASHTHSYAPLDGTGTSGSWPISVTGSSASCTGNAATATTANNASYILSGDSISRNPSNVNPNAVARALRADFVAAGTVGGTGNYSGVLTYSPWDGTTGSTGDSSYQLAFINETGINGSGNAGLRLRKGIDTSWGSWVSLITSANYNSYSPTLTGGGASGTWGISVSGNAATASAASTVAVNESASNAFYDMLWRSGNTVFVASAGKAQLNPATGDMRLGGHVSFAYTSDENLKTSIKEIENPLAKLCSLRTATYIKKSIHPDEAGTHSYTSETGFIAQDLEKVIPNLVYENKERFKVIRGGGFEIEALLAAAIKELKQQHDAEIEELKQQIAELKSLI